jgi:hypothetical protein
MVHGLGIKVFWNVPDMVAFDDGRRAAGEDAVFVMPRRRREASLEVIADRFGGDDRDGSWPQVIVELAAGDS